MRKGLQQIDALLKEFFIAGGMYCGLGDSRPEFGRFEVEKFEVTK